MKKKSLISLMLAGAMLTGVAVASSGCGKSTNEEYDTKIYNEKLMARNLIVVLTQKKKETVHLADVYCLTYKYAYETSSVSNLHLACGQQIMTDSFMGYPLGMPGEDAYDEKCLICFNK